MTYEENCIVISQIQCHSARNAFIILCNIWKIQSTSCSFTAIFSVSLNALAASNVKIGFSVTHKIYQMTFRILENTINENVYKLQTQNALKLKYYRLPDICQRRNISHTIFVSIVL